MAVSNRTCSVPECESGAHARGWCAHHYNLWYRTGGLVGALTPELCLGCGGALPPKPASGPRASYCSAGCRSRSGYARTGKTRDATRRAEAREKRLCQWLGCGEVLREAGGKRPSKWCAEHRRERKRIESPDNLARECSEADCTRPVRARNVCSMHWKRLRADEIGHTKQSFDGDRMRRHYERRTWQKAGENVTVAGLRERDGDACGICGMPIDFSLSGRNALGRSVDHVLPRSKGGAHSWANTQLAHLRCNISKGAKIPDSVTA